MMKKTWKKVIWNKEKLDYIKDNYGKITSKEIEKVINKIKEFLE